MTSRCRDAVYTLSPHIIGSRCRYVPFVAHVVPPPASDRQAFRPDLLEAEWSFLSLAFIILPPVGKTSQARGEGIYFVSAPTMSSSCPTTQGISPGVVALSPLRSATVLQQYRCNDAQHRLPISKRLRLKRVDCWIVTPAVASEGLESADRLAVHLRPSTAQELRGSCSTVG
eukprot:1186137-Prorocentrum_minimum.AAC.1